MRRTTIGRAAGPMLAVAWAVAACATPAGAQDTMPDFDRVEEDWELVIGQPDLVAEGPQLTTSMSPTGDLAGLFVAFNLNYRSRPSFDAGGLEAVAYDGERATGSSSQGTARLATSGETITWTQAMQLTGGGLSYEIVEGRSTTWDRFGQGSGANLSVQVTTGLGSLESYRPATSVAGSGAGWQANRVTSMRLVRVRYLDGGQVVAVDETPRPVDLGG